MSKRNHLGPAMLDRIAEQFKALSEPSRLALMSLLFDAELSVGALAERSGRSLANVSKHLAVLHQAGFVARRKEGVSVLYSLADTRAHRLCELMCEKVSTRATAQVRLLATRARASHGRGLSAKPALRARTVS